VESRIKISLLLHELLERLQVLLVVQQAICEQLLILLGHPRVPSLPVHLLECEI